MKRSRVSEYVRSSETRSSCASPGSWPRPAAGIASRCVPTLQHGGPAQPSGDTPCGRSKKLGRKERHREGAPLPKRPSDHPIRRPLSRPCVALSSAGEGRPCGTGPTLRSGPRREPGDQLAFAAPNPSKARTGRELITDVSAGAGHYVRAVDPQSVGGRSDTAAPSPRSPAAGPSPPLLIEFGLDRSDVFAGAFGADPTGAVAVTGLDDVGAPGQRRVAVLNGIGDPATDRARFLHNSFLRACDLRLTRQPARGMLFRSVTRATSSAGRCRPDRPRRPAAVPWPAAAVA
ncbi:MAG: hypothetical protein QOG22_2502 [Pseudonocardiales bacterium]|nr:hypothetical protein [Pseudonocardiales bacterium]